MDGRPLRPERLERPALSPSANLLKECSNDFPDGLAPGKPKFHRMALPIDIFGYFDYRLFLRDYYDARKANERSFSYRWFAQRAGYNSSGLYSSIVAGKVNLTDRTLPMFAAAMKLEPDEEAYFALMVDFTHATTPEGKQEIFDKMVPLMPERIQRAALAQKEYYSDWRYAAVHHALSICEVRDDYAELARIFDPPMSIAEARRAVELLETIGLAKRAPTGIWESTSKTLMGGAELGVDLIRSYQASLIDEGKRALREIPKEKRQISTTTFSVSNEGKERILKKLADVQREIFEIVKSDVGENAVCQLNIQFFPLTREKGR